MTRLDNSSPAYGAGAAYNGSQALAQISSADGKKNYDQALQAVQGQAPDGRIVKGTLLQRIYGTGYVSYFFKGSGASHALPTTLTSRADALAYVRAQISKGTWTDLVAGDPSAFDKTRSAAPGSKSLYILPISASSVVRALMGVSADYEGRSVSDNIATASQVFSQSPLAQRYVQPSTVSKDNRDSALEVRNTYQDGFDFRQTVQSTAAYIGLSQVQPERLATMLKSIGIDTTSTEFMRGMAAATADIKSKEPPAIVTIMNNVSTGLGMVSDMRITAGVRPNGGAVRRPTVTQNRPVAKPVRPAPGVRPKTDRPAAKVPAKQAPTNRVTGTGTGAGAVTIATLNAEPLVQLTRAQLARKDVAGAARGIDALKASETQARRAGNTERADAIGTVRKDLEAQRSLLMRNINQPQSSALLSAEQAQRSFNNPEHWDTSGSVIKPKAGSLTGIPLIRWERLNAKFPGLTEKLFDANVRGGFDAIDAVLRQAKSSTSVTVGDLADLHVLAFDSGAKNSLGQATSFNRTLHDAVHSIVRYGVNSEQEWKGDLFAEKASDLVFTGVSAVKLDPKRSLSDQPEAAKQIAAHIKTAYGELKLENIVEEINGRVDSFSNPQGLPKQAAGWEKKPRENAERAEQILNQAGALAHLDNAGYASIKAMIYGPKNSNSFEAIPGPLSKGGSPEKYRQDVTAWVERVKTQVVSLSKGNMISEAEFTFHAERAVALGLVLNRQQPGVMSDGPLSTPLDASKLQYKTRNLDLRTTYPAALQDVRKALSAAQK